MNSRHVKRIASRKLTGANGKPISRSRWKDGFGGDYGPSRGDPRTGAFRPIATSQDAVRYVRFTSILLKNPVLRRARCP